jgi:hypothetical protein
MHALNQNNVLKFYAWCAIVTLSSLDSHTWGRCRWPEHAAAISQPLNRVPGMPSLEDAPSAEPECPEVCLSARASHRAPAVSSHSGGGPPHTTGASPSNCASAVACGPTWPVPRGDRYETTNHLWLILEYCVGGDLLALLRQDIRLPESSIHDFARDLVISLQVDRRAQTDRHAPRRAAHAAGQRTVSVTECQCGVTVAGGVLQRTIVAAALPCRCSATGHRLSTLSSAPQHAVPLCSDERLLRRAGSRIPLRPTLVAAFARVFGFWGCQSPRAEPLVQRSGQTAGTGRRAGRQ